MSSQLHLAVFPWGFSDMIIFSGKTYDVAPYDSQRSHPSMDLGVKLDLRVLFVQTAVKMSGLQICLHCV